MCPLFFDSKATIIAMCTLEAWVRHHNRLNNFGAVEFSMSYSCVEPAHRTILPQLASHHLVKHLESNHML